MTTSNKRVLLIIFASSCKLRKNRSIFTFKTIILFRRGYHDPLLTAVIRPLFEALRKAKRLNPYLVFTPLARPKVRQRKLDCVVRANLGIRVNW